MTHSSKSPIQENIDLNEWDHTTLGKVVNPSRPRVKPYDKPSLPFIGMDHIEAHTMKLLGTVPAETMKSPAVHFLPGDVLYGRLRPYLNKVYCPDFEGLCSAEFIVFPKTEGLNSKYLMYFLNSIEFMRFATNLNSGDRPRVKFEQLASYPFPLPSFEQQIRIIAEIEKQFSRLDEAVENLNRVKANLKRYKASILKAAVEGKLTEEWRKNHPDVESAEILLDRILTERRKKWEQVELAKKKAKGKEPKDDKWKKKYKETLSPVIDRLYELPEKWKWSSFGQLIQTINAGKSFKCNERPPEGEEIGVVKVSAVSWGEFNELESKTVTDTSKINQNYLIHPGDFLFSRANTIELVGACVIAKSFKRKLMLSDKILRLDLTFDLKKWCLVCLRTRFGRNEIESLATGNQESMRNISQANIMKIRLPLPPLEEQEAVINEVEQILTQCEMLDKICDANLKRADRLRQSILKKAFSGKLVPQEEIDEPASGLSVN
jgi:type I restriction enzyme S subunit